MKLMIVSLMTLILASNSFGESFTIQPPDRHLTAKEAKSASKAAKINNEKNKTDEMFITINESIERGNCFVNIQYNNLPDNSYYLLKLLGYRISSEDSQGMQISWCE